MHIPILLCLVCGACLLFGWQILRIFWTHNRGVEAGVGGGLLLDLSLIGSRWTIYSVLWKTSTRQDLKLYFEWNGKKACLATYKISQNIIPELKISWRMVGLCSKSRLWKQSYMRDFCNTLWWNGTFTATTAATTTAGAGAGAATAKVQFWNIMQICWWPGL